MNHFNTKRLLERTPRGRKRRLSLTSILIIRMKRGSKLNIEEFDYHLPESLIAQTPLKIETKSRLLVLQERLVK